MSVDVGDAATLHPLALRPGATLDDRYRLLRVLGCSSASASYVAQDGRTSDLVLVEEFLPRALVTRRADGSVQPHTSSEDIELTRGARRFAREGERLSEIDHPNLLRVLRSFETNRTAYVVMSYCEALPLHRFLAAAGGRLAPAPATELVRCLLDALDAMHADGIFHRMLAPESVQVDVTGRLLLRGVSASRHLASQAPYLADGFAPIEMYGSKGIGPWTDVYGASALLYYLVTGTAPTPAVERASGQTLAAPASPDVPASLVSAIMRGLAQLPEQRPHSASEMARLLSGVSSSSVAVLAPVVPSLPAPFAPHDQSSAEPRRAQPRPLPDDGHAEATSDGSTMLRFTDGVVLPEKEHSRVSRVRAWLSAHRPRQHDDGLTKDEQALLDRSARFELALPPIEVSSPVPVDVLVPSTEPPKEPSEPSTDTSLLTSAQTSPIARPRLRLSAFARKRTARTVRVVGTVIVLAVGAVGAAWAARSTIRNSRVARTPDSAQPAAATLTMPDDSTSAHVSAEAAGTIVQAGGLAAADSARTIVRSERPRVATRTAEHRPDSTTAALAALANLSVPVAAANGAPQLLPADVVLDIRDRLAQGRLLAEGGDYAGARRTMRAALQAIDSAGARYVSSDALRTLRGDVEKASQSALDACNAENEFRKRRDGKVLPCG